MKILNFKSCLASKIQRFINLRRLSGTDYLSQARLLEYFDHFLVEAHLNKPRITRKITDGYQQSLSRLAPRSQYNRFSVVRQLCRYLAGSDPLGYVPEPLKMIPSQTAHYAYIYSHSEISALMREASRLSPVGSLRPHTYSTILGLLYSTGIRIGEAFALNIEDFHGTEQRLYIAEGKFRKSRWLPLSDSTCMALQQYAHRRPCMRPRSQDSPLFINQRFGRLRHCTFNQTFRQLLRESGIPHNNKTGPRIHDLRHTFAVRRLMEWYRDGQDVNARLPALATYMGHVDICSSHHYLRPTAELLSEVCNRFHNHYINNVKSKGDKS
jgi:site-specific recombinase XerD